MFFMINRHRIAKSRRIADELRKEYSNVDIPVGTPVASASDLAKQFQVSIQTAHNALNFLVEDGFLYRIRGSGTYFNGNPKKKKKIGIADEIVSAEYLSPDVNKILDYHIQFSAEYFQESGYDVEIIPYRKFLDATILQDLDGLLISSMYLNERLDSILSKTKIPIVVYRYNHLIEFDNYSRLTYDLLPGMREALNFVNIESAGKVIIICETTESGQQEMKSWLDALAEHGMHNSEIIRDMIDVAERAISCYRFVRVNSELFRNAVVLTGNDEIALDIMNALSLENMTGGKDYRLIGIGNRAGYGSPVSERLGIASIDLPIKLMSEEAAKLLQFKVEKRSNCISRVQVPTFFVPRKSAIT